MKVRDFIERLRDLPPDALVCVAELQEAFAANVADIESVEDARVQSDTADGRERVELANGKDKVVVIRW